MKKINLILTSVLCLMLTLAGCKSDCCDSERGSMRPHFFYLDEDGNDLLNQELPNHYDWDFIYFTLIQMDNEFKITPRISGKVEEEMNPDISYTGVNGIQITGYPSEYLIIENTETILIHLSDEEIDTVVYDVFFPSDGQIFSDYRNLTVNGVPYERNEGGYITIIKNE